MVVIAVAIIVGAVIVAAPLVLVAHNIVTLQKDLNWHVDRLIEHDTRWRRS